MIRALPALKDNYIWAVVNDAGQVIVVDPGVAEPVIAFLKNQALDLDAILITHKHADHTHGVFELLEKFPRVSVYGPGQKLIPGVTHEVVDGQRIVLAGFAEIHVLAIPGHTFEHVAYELAQHLFCGDTLFSAGCGRVFDGSYEQLFKSLQKIASLSPDTKICCGHEYTLENLKFAQMLEPSNEAVRMHVQKCEQLRVQGLPTLPSTLALEKKLNPFLRLDALELRENLQRHLTTDLTEDLEIFTALRQWKNAFT
jgi:hydroxyacylglutathione hydrolase